ncbi:MAG: ATP-binding protein [Aquabacterium sp.]|uniref:ATP-binding protein n=1 Tax=Aquabacterium sp. TaxID=1872578 RepID=UPI002719FA59|nr:ATP-binding protein [Aquabacterium sp.]MDO9005235.1 ATP-binding protein [Aquabacterium sp.]
MMSAFKSSLQRKLLAVMLLTTLAALIVALGAMIIHDLRAYHRTWVNDMTAQAELLARTTAPALTFDDKKVAHENLSILRYQPKVRAAAIYSPDGSLFATHAGHGEPPVFPKLPAEDGVEVSKTSLVIFKNIMDGADVIGTVYLKADYELFDRVVNFSGIAVAVMLMSMLVALLVSTWLQKIVTRPILEIGKAAREVVSQRDYSRRVNKISEDEVGELVDSFNNMLIEIERRTLALETSNREKVREVDERRNAQHEIMRLNQELEQRVQERTRQLETSNHELALATQAAESANQAKSEFLSSMSHELRTPLNAIIGFGQLLTSDVMSPTAEQKKTFTEHILRAGRHLLELINEILNLAQIESGHLSLSLEPVSLQEILQDCHTMIEPLGDQRGIRTLFPTSCDLNVMADRTRLKQVLLNLLSNAIKYNRDMGAVVVDCTSASPDRVRVSVQDTGMGLSEAQLKLLFQPFNRLGQEAGAQEGTGIGLVVTKHLIESMGGEIGVTSTVGMGSVFWIELRATEPVPAISHRDVLTAMAPKETAPKQHQTYTVLYVEDNPESLKLVEQILSTRPDIRLLSAPDGRLGVELARVHLPDVILMDNNLPNLDGASAQAILRNDPKTRHIPVIALTANAMPKSINQGLAAGFFRYITKPINIKELLEAINAGLEASVAEKSEH